MKKGKKFLSADYPTADMVVGAILNLKRMRSWDKKPVDDLFKNFNDEVGSRNEAGRVIEFLIADRVIIKDGKKYKWHGDVNHWDDRDWRRQYVLAMLLNADETKPIVVKRPGKKTSVFEQIVETTVPEKVQEDSPKISYDCSGKLNLQEMSDDELTNLQFQVQQEFDRRAAIRERQAKLAQVLELAEMSKEELMDLLGTV